MNRKHRPYAELPRDLYARLAERVEETGDELPYLYFFWVSSAAALVQAGHGDLLPPKRAPRGTVGEQKVVRWIQGADSYAHCKALIDGAGSSVPAVLRRAAQRYLTSSSDAPALSWPPKGVVRLAA